jgi:hypothetical protein
LKPVVLVLVLVLGCKRHSSEPAAAQRDAHPIAVDWDHCLQTLHTVPQLPDMARTQALLEGCEVCGDWRPLIEWNTPHEKAGPTRQDIEERMVACGAFCSSDAKQKFMGALDAQRGMPGRGPWRYLGDVCKDKVSAVPDSRYESAPYFALDRIARLASAHGVDTADLVLKIDLPLPAFSLTGNGVDVPDASGELVTAPAVQVTLLGDGPHVGKLPRAHLGAGGVMVDWGGQPYPGPKVEPDALAEAIHALDPSPHPKVTLFVPREMPRAKADEMLGKAPDVEFHLAATAPSFLPGWPIVMVTAQKW